MLCIRVEGIGITSCVKGVRAMQVGCAKGYRAGVADSKMQMGRDRPHSVAAGSIGHCIPVPISKCSVKVRSRILPYDLADLDRATLV